MNLPAYTNAGSTWKGNRCGREFDSLLLTRHALFDLQTCRRLTGHNFSDMNRGINFL